MRSPTRILTILLAVLCVLTVAPPDVRAQTKTSVQFEHDAESVALTVAYDYGYFADATSASPITVVSVPKSQISSVSGQTYTGPLPRPIIGSTVVRLRAVAADPKLTSPWSDTATDPFVSPLRAPTAVR